MAIKQTLTLCLFSFFTLTLTINGADVAAPSADCMSILMNMADCLTFAENGSTITKPEKGCCPGFKMVVEQKVECLCVLFTNSADLGITLDFTKALTLPSVCHVKTPPFSQCNITLPGVSSPATPPVTLPRVSSPAKPPVTLPDMSSPAKPPVTLPGVSSPATPPVTLPGVSSPAKSPVTLPGVSSPATPPVTLPGVSSPATPPVTLPDVSSPATPPVTLPRASSPAAPPFTLSGVSSPETPPAALAPSDGDTSSTSTGEDSSPSKSMAAMQIKAHRFTTITVAIFASMLIFCNSINLFDYL